ncbi:phosphoglycerate dehydrogenase [candidate division KSB1 bacterium]|nr:phosphoglycerate dehydrogenase [candidate division KSB1 bacterium]
MIKNIIFDFGSTIIDNEGVDLIIDAALKRNMDPEHAQKMEKVHKIAAQVQNGEIPLGDFLRSSFQLTNVTQDDIRTVTSLLANKISDQVLDTISGLQQRGKNIFVFSSNFEEVVRPVTTSLDIPSENVFANQLLYDNEGKVIGFNENNPLFLSVGKVFLAEQLRIEGVLDERTAVVGNSHTDLAIRKSNNATMFVYYSTQNTMGDIKGQADFVVDRFDQLMPLFCTNEELSNETAEAYAVAINGKQIVTPHIILLENIHKNAFEQLSHQDFTVELFKSAWSEQEICEKAIDAHALGIRSKTRITRKHFECLSNLWAIGAYCIGTNQIDLHAASNAGIPVFNAPYSNTRSVAEIVAGEIIMLMRRVFEKSSAAHQGRWLKSAQGCNEVRGKTVGIIGYGHIGSQVSVLLEVLGMSVIFHDIVDILPLGNAQKAASLDDLLQRSDVVTLHVPDTELTRGMIGTNELKKFKSGSFLINSSRGQVVDLDALAHAIKSNHLAGAAVDVYPEEPSHPDDTFQSPLQGLNNVILTPHIGGSTEEAQINIAHYVSTKLKNFLLTGSTIGAVNFPEVDLARVEGTHRILHIHRNVPGVLAKINSVLSRRNVNIEGQILQTRGEIGYLLVDIDRHVSDHVLDLLRHISETIKTRKIV